MLAGALARFFEPENYGPPASAGPPSLQGPARQFLTDPSSHPLAALAPFLCKAWFARRIPRSRGSSSPARFAHFMLVFLYRERMQKKELFPGTRSLEPLVLPMTRHGSLAHLRSLARPQAAYRNTMHICHTYAQGHTQEHNA